MRTASACAGARWRHRYAAWNSLSGRAARSPDAVRLRTRNAAKKLATGAIGAAVRMAAVSIQKRSEADALACDEELTGQAPPYRLQ
jgi:hypothetical protein